MATFSKFDCFVADLANKVHNLGGDALKIMLTNTGPSQTNTIKANITEIRGCGHFQVRCIGKLARNIL